jgi:enoyl-CoA hydratase/carnithine racemase
MGPPLVSDERGRRTITLNRPSILNALTLDDLSAIRDAVAGIDATVRALVLTGAGDRAFSAGLHIDTFAEAGPGDGRQIIERVGACVGAIRLAPVPTIAVINGYCLGGAFEMALACDVRVATPDARFGLPEVKLGIPSVVEAALLLHHVGLSKAKEMLLTGDLYAAADLPDGLVNRTAAPDRLPQATDELLASLTRPMPEVTAAQKSLVETWLNVGLQQGIETSKEVFADVFAAPATAEAIARYRRDRG